MEFALVLPFLLVMILALLQVGLLARDRLVIEAATRAGAREAAVTPDDIAVRDVVVAAGPGLDPTLLSVSVARTGTRGDPVTVSVLYADPIGVPFVDWLFGTTVTFRAGATTRQEFG